MRIAIVGPYPPPFGGISVHIQRLEKLLLADDHTPVLFKGIGARRWVLENWRACSDYDVVHFHDTHWVNRVLIGLLGFLGMPVVLTIHGDNLQDQLSGAGWLKRRLLCSAMRHIAHVIAVKSEIRDLLLSIGVTPARVSVINAYLPPILQDPVTLPGEVQSFVDSHSPLITANGFGVVPLSPDKDLYGIELTLDLCARLVGEFPDLGCLFFLAQVGDEERYERLVRKTQELGLSDHFRFVLGQELVPTLTKTTAFLRPTFRDGYGVSVDEALHFGVPAVASDVVRRGEGALLFDTGDLEDAYDKTRQILRDDVAPVNLTKLSPMSCYDGLLSVYRTVIGSQKSRG